MVDGRTAAALWGVASRTCSILLAVFLCSCPQAFFSNRLVSVHFAVSTQSLIERNNVSCYRSGLTSDDLHNNKSWYLWTPAYGQSKAGRPARTYIQQLCDDTGCNPENLPEGMNDTETWRERVRDIRASRTT